MVWTYSLNFFQKVRKQTVWKNCSAPPKMRHDRVPVNIVRNHCMNIELIDGTFVRIFYRLLWGTRVMKCRFDCRLPVGKAPKTRRHLCMCRCWQGSLFSCCQRLFYFHKDMFVSVLQYVMWIIYPWCVEEIFVLPFAW